jgi:hypothetical protein
MYVVRVSHWLVPHDVDLAVRRRWADFTRHSSGQSEPDDDARAESKNAGDALPFQATSRQRANLVDGPYRKGSALKVSRAK